jgi:hypothetical protein
LSRLEVPRDLQARMEVWKVSSWRGRDVRENPVCHLRALLSTRLVPEAEMHAVVDTDIHHIGCHVREASIGAALLRGLRVIASRNFLLFVKPSY